MRILIIRHGDPDYSIDSLTEKGKREAELLSYRMEKEEVAAFYVSPLGRARHTAQYTLDRMGREAEVCDWLREFPAVVDKPNEHQDCAWDWLPRDLVAYPDFFDREKWMRHPAMEAAKVPELYATVCKGLDELLEKHGYVREGDLYRASRPNRDTIVLFCHFGLTCVLLSHLLNVSPMVLWQGFCSAPTSVTTLYTEEREEGFAYFRAARVMAAVKSVGDSLDMSRAAAYVSDFYRAGIIDRRCARLILTAISDKALRPIAPESRDYVRSSIFKHIMLCLMNE